MQLDWVITPELHFGERDLISLSLLTQTKLKFNTFDYGSSHRNFGKPKNLVTSQGKNGFVFGYNFVMNV